MKQFSVAATSSKNPKGKLTYKEYISKMYGGQLPNFLSTEHWTMPMMYGAVGEGAVSHQDKIDLSQLVTKVKAELMKLEKPTIKNN